MIQVSGFYVQGKLCLINHVKFQLCQSKHQGFIVLNMILWPLAILCSFMDT